MMRNQDQRDLYGRQILNIECRKNISIKIEKCIYSWLMYCHALDSYEKHFFGHQSSILCF